MKTITRFSIALLVSSIAAVVADAQSTANDRPPLGVLGQNYGEFSFGWDKINHALDFYDVSLTGNAAVTRNLDLTGSLGYGWLHGDNEGRANMISGGPTFYTSREGVKPFVSLALGYISGAGRIQFDDWVWSAAAGCEIPVGTMTLTPRISYTDDFRTPARSSQHLTGEVEGNCWLTHSTALFASLGYTDVHRSEFDAWNWRAGVRMKF